MKRVMLITIFAIIGLFQYDFIFAGYENTKEEEIKERIGSGHEADITTMKEEIARVESVDDAYATKNQENEENLANVNDAYTTSAAEMAEQLGENASGL